MSDTDQLVAEINSLKQRVQMLENRTKKEMVPAIQDKLPKKTYAGLVGGIQLLIDKGYFDELRQPSSVVKELSKEGYFHSLQSVDKTIRIGFLKNKKLLTRIKQNSKWVYAIRK